SPRRRMSGPAIIRWRKPSLAGAILRPIAPTCCSRARPAWASPRLMRRNPNTKYSGRSSWRSPTSGADSRGGRHRGRPTLNEQRWSEGSSRILDERRDRGGESVVLGGGQLHDFAALRLDRFSRLLFLLHMQLALQRNRFRHALRVAR